MEGSVKTVEVECACGKRTVLRRFDLVHSTVRCDCGGVYVLTMTELRSSIDDNSRAKSV
jgi:hypothetical protein